MYRLTLLLVLVGGVARGAEWARMDMVVHKQEGDQIIRWHDRPDVLVDDVNLTFYAPSDDGRNGYGGDFVIKREAPPCTIVAKPIWAQTTLYFCGVQFGDLGYSWDNPRPGIGTMTWRKITERMREATITSDLGPVDILGIEYYDITGDTNHDGSIDAVDAGALFERWGQREIYFPFFDGGITDAYAAGMLFERWTGDAAPVPEPSTAAALAPAILLLPFLRQYRRWQS